MSWTETYPVFTEEMVDEFEASATPEEIAELDCWYDVEKIFNPQDKPHIVSFSLFWKNVQETDPDLPEPTRERMRQSKEQGLTGDIDPWEYQVKPLLEETPALLKNFPETVVRVHLAKDLEFLIPDLVAAGCEVWWMKHDSIRFAPGGMWRLLPLGEKGKLVTVADATRMPYISADIERTRAMAREGLGVWRVPVPLGESVDGKVHYRPFIGCQAGVVGGWPVRHLLQAFTWHTLRGSIDSTVALPGCAPLPIPWASWPNACFDEWFLAVAFYPRVAGAGVLTFVPANQQPALMMLDIEYVTWANPNSQLVLFPAESCCAPQGGLPAGEVPDQDSLRRAHRIASVNKPTHDELD